jgi:hypothetical protein
VDNQIYQNNLKNQVSVPYGDGNVDRNEVESKLERIPWGDNTGNPTTVTSLKS